MSILDRVTDKACWEAFLAYKKSDGHLSSCRERALADFIAAEAYLPVAEQIRQENRLPLPRVKELNKKGTGKKRRVFVFAEGENYVLKLIAWLLHDYDGLFSPNLYSFRRSVGVKRAVADILRHRSLGSLYSYKADIHDYFNSVDPAAMVALTGQYLREDPRLAGFLEALLLEPCAISGDQVVELQKGIMAGMPISGFLANLYLKDMDEWFFERNILYARYSDDIIVFAETEADIARYEQTIKEFLREKGLTINSKKEMRTAPGAAWEFLGFAFQGGTIDISGVALQKMKDKIRRKARALVRWKSKTGASGERAIKAFIRHFNAKFYDNPRENELTWCRWYFPTLTTDRSLQLLDAYMVANIRYIATGKHTKSNYALRYEAIKALGYRSLVNAYYAYKKTGSL